MTTSVRQLVEGVGQLFDWWWAELGSLVPERLRRKFADTSAHLVLIISYDHIDVFFESGRRLQSLGSLRRGDGESLQNELRSLLEKRHLAGAVASRKVVTCIRLRPDQSLRAIIELPIAAEQNLTEVISFELDRHTPFRADQVYFASRVLERNSDDRLLRVEIALALRSTISELLATTRAFGLRPERVDIADDDGVHAASANLLPAEANSVPPVLAKLVNVLVAGSVVLMAAAVYVPIDRVHRRVDLLRSELKVAAQSVELKSRIDNLVKERRFLVERKLRMPTVSRLLYATTHILPDDTWLTKWSLNGDEVEIAGVTRSAAGLIGLLERSAVFRDANFRSPVIRDPVSGGERFDIATQVRGENAR